MDQFYVVAILLLVFVMGFFTDMFGIAIAQGPFWLGLVIPNGPPLGATLVERSETIIMEIIMPFSFAFIGLSTDFSAMTEAGWSTLGPLFTLVISGYLSKFLSTLMAAIMVAVPSKDSLALSLVLSLRGQVELILYVHWVDKNVCFLSSSLSLASKLKLIKLILFISFELYFGSLQADNTVTKFLNADIKKTTV